MFSHLRHALALALVTSSLLHAQPAATPSSLPDTAHAVDPRLLGRAHTSAVVRRLVPHAVAWTPPVEVNALWDALLRCADAPMHQGLPAHRQIAWYRVPGGRVTAGMGVHAMALSFRAGLFGLREPVIVLSEPASLDPAYLSHELLHVALAGDHDHTHPLFQTGACGVHPGTGGAMPHATPPADWLRSGRRSGGAR